MPDRPLVSRRTALGLAALGASTTACDVDDLRPPADDAAPTPTASVEPTVDESIVDEVLGALAVAVTLLKAGRRVPELRVALTPLLRAHRQHERALEGPVDAVPATTPPSLPDIRHAEQSLRVLLVDAAGRAESGALARLLASAAASVSQHLVVLG